MNVLIFWWQVLMAAMQVPQTYLELAASFLLAGLMLRAMIIGRRYGRG